MAKYIPEKLVIFFENTSRTLDDGFEYSSELHRLLSTSDCQDALSSNEIEALRHFAEEVKKVGEINLYTSQRVHNIEKEIFGQRGVLGYLSHRSSSSQNQTPM